MTFEDNHGSKVLAMARPDGTSAVSIYSPAANRRAVITKIMIAEVAGGTTVTSVFVDDDGTTYDQTTALQYGLASSANGVREYDFPDGLEIEAAGNVAVQVATADSHNFVVLGREFDVQG